jgi:hypothetical protein
MNPAKENSLANTKLGLQASVVSVLQFFAKIPETLHR